MKLIYIDKGCWHLQLEKKCQFWHLNNKNHADHHMSATNCLVLCPRCLNQVESYILPVVKKELRSFLVETFLKGQNIQNLPQSLVRRISQLDNLPCVMYGKSAKTRIAS